MSKERMDIEMQRAFPHATYIDSIESTVLKDRGDAVHIYPAEFTLRHIRTYQAHTNDLAARLIRHATQVDVEGELVPVRINKITDVDTLPDGRVFTRSRYAGPYSLDNCVGKLWLPRWFSKIHPTYEKVRLLDIAIDKRVVHDIGMEHIPEEFELDKKNIHIERNGFTIVDIAGVLARIL